MRSGFTGSASNQGFNGGDEKRNAPIMECIALRQWRDNDLDAFAAMNSDSEVMRYFPAPMDRAQSAAIMTQQRALIEKRGWELWAVDVDGTFAGMTGLAVPAIRVPCMPCVEIGWRLRREFWG